MLNMSITGRLYFNSRPSARGDGCGKLRLSTTRIFQFTPLREGRRDWQDDYQGERSHFNSRPSARGDFRLSKSCNRERISIHAPPRGATHSFRFLFHRHRFQFTPLREGRHTLVSLCVTHNNFNSRPSARGDVSSAAGTGKGNTFQFTPLREGRQVGRCAKASVCNFNSRPSARGDTMRWSRQKKRDIFQFTPLREGRHAPTSFN